MNEPLPTYSTTEVGHLLGISPGSVRATARGDAPYPAWPCTRVGRRYRFTRQDVRDVLDMTARGPRTAQRPA